MYQLFSQDPVKIKIDINVANSFGLINMKRSRQIDSNVESRDNNHRPNTIKIRRFSLSQSKSSKKPTTYTLLDDTQKSKEEDRVTFVQKFLKSFEEDLQRNYETKFPHKPAKKKKPITIMDKVNNV